MKKLNVIFSISEKEFQNQIIDILKLYSWKYYHTYSSLRSVAGFPYLCMCRDKRIIFAELKIKKGKATVKQEKWIEKLNNTPAEVYTFIQIYYRKRVICSKNKSKPSIHVFSVVCLP